MVAKCPQTEKIPLQRVYFGLFRGVISLKCAHKCTNYQRNVCMWKAICSRKSVLFQIDLISFFCLIFSKCETNNSFQLILVS